MSPLLVLVIEDDDVMRELLGLHLTSAGYRVLLADNGIAGGYLVPSSQPDLLLVDVVKADPLTRHIPAVFLTGRDDVDERCVRLGAEGYLKKPVKLWTRG